MALDPLASWWRERASHDHRHAGRVMLGVAVPGLVLIAAGHPELILYAVLGSFAGMYGRLEQPAERLRHQFHGAGMVVTGVALGLAVSHLRAGPAVLILTVTAFATVGSLVADRLQLRPGGPFFGIFALGATATVGPELVSWWVALAICAGSAAFALWLGIAASGLRTVLHTLRLESPLRRNRFSAGAFTHASRYALATAAAGTAGMLLGVDHANWAMTAAAVPLAVVTSGDPPDIPAVLRRARERVSGTLIGLVVTALVLVPEPSATVLAIVVMVLMFPTELFMSRRHGVALGFFTPLIMIMTELADPADPLTMLLARGVDTLIGVTAGVAAAVLVRRP
ncbi:FUSC family protein [Nocardioides rotundus]|uniref:FUSC family protein n=1 Tax=Nocardioides rotundus TaxID=1774216 RepID=UPI001CBD3C2B|nr:FUSC family protein [Nocardioides rotundus]UAL31130.1 FUSC family protein [Nocardioides rotundus]